jgi:outer membrane protein
MRKQKILIACLISMIYSSAALGQKIGYIDLTTLLRLTPEAARIDSLLDKFQRDSLSKRLELLAVDYKYRDSILKSKDTTNMPLSVKQQHQYVMQTINYQIQNWQSISEQLVTEKRDQLIRPVYMRLVRVIEKIAYEKGYTYVYDKSVLLAGPKGDDLLPAVARELNIKLPPEVVIGLRSH